MWWISNIWCQFVVSLAREVCSQTYTVNLIAWKSSERLLFQCVPSMVSQVASISLEQLTGVRTSLFAPGKSTQPNVTHHRPPDVFGNDPLVKFGRGWTERNQRWSLWCPSTACTWCLYRSSTKSLIAQLEVSRALGEIKGRVMNKVLAPSPRALGRGTQRWLSPSSEQNTPTFCKQGGALSTLSVPACYCFSKTSAWDVARGQAEEWGLSPLHLLLAVAPSPYRSGWWVWCLTSAETQCWKT